MKTVSVIMPAYNAEKYIAKAINSIINQSFTDWELIIVEDCSTDNTYNEIMKIRDDRICVLKNDRNRGISYSTNRGIASSCGKYIALMDDDDISLPDRLEIQLDYLQEHDDIDVVGGRSIEINENGELLSYCDAPKRNPKFIKAQLLFSMVNFTNSTLMFRSEFIEKNNILLCENCYGIQDFRFYMECSKYGQLTALEQPLIKHRIYSTSTTKNMIKQKSEERAMAYALLQKDSFQTSGFQLSEQQLQIIYKATKEGEVDIASIDEVNLLQDTLKEILQQARSMQIDYYTELYIVCKKIFLTVLYKQDVFNITIK